MAFTNDYKEFTLDNGLHVVLQRTSTKTIAGEMQIDFGASDELPGEDGLVHFMEHNLINGGSEKYSPEQSREVLEKFGRSNAHTNARRVSFSVDMLRGDLELWLDWVSEHAFRPRFDPEILEQERQRVLREISDDVSKPNYQFNKDFRKRLYRTHPINADVLGKEEVVSSADATRLREIHSRGFSPEVSDLILVGDVPDYIVQTITDYFSNHPSKGNMRKRLLELSPLEERTVMVRTASERLKQTNPNESSAEVHLAFPIPASPPDFYALQWLNYIFGGDKHSVLFEEISRKRGLAYHVSSNINNRFNAGNMSAYASVSANQLGTTIDLLFSCMDKLKAERINEKTHERLTRAIKYSQMKSIETNEGLMKKVKEYLETGITSEQKLQGLCRVTADEVLEAARKYLPAREENYILAVEDPTGKFSAEDFT